MPNLITMLQSGHITEAIKPQTGASARSGDWVSLANYKKCAILVHIAQGNAATTALTVDRATTTAGASEDTGITLTNFWTLEDTPTTSDTWTKGTAAASITTSATGTGSSLYLIDIDAAALDDGTGYMAIQLEAGISNTNNVISATYILYGNRYPAAAPPSAL